MQCLAHRISEALGRIRLSAFMALEIVFLYHLHRLTNPLPFHRFMNSWLDSVSPTSTVETYLQSLSVIERYYIYCHSHCRCTSSPPVSAHFIMSLLRKVYQALQSAIQHTPSASTYKRLILELRSTPGLETMDSQLFVMNCATLQLFLPHSLLLFYVHSSSSTQNSLSISRFPGYERKTQVEPIIRKITTSLPHLLPYQAHALLSILSHGDADKRPQNVVFQNHFPYTTCRSADGSIILKRLNMRTGRLELVPPLSLNNLFRPNWLRSLDEYSGWVHLASSEKYVLSESPNSDSHALQGWISEICQDRPNRAWVTEYQSILLCGSFVVLRNIEQLVCDHLECSHNSLKRAIRTQQQGGGVQMTIDLDCLESSAVLVGKGDFNHLTHTQVPKNGLLRPFRTHFRTGYYFEDEKWAKLSLYLHILFQIHSEKRPSWYMYHLQRHVSGFMLLIAGMRSMCPSICLASTLVFPDQGTLQGTFPSTQIYASHLDRDGVGGDPIPLWSMEDTMNL